MKKIRNISVAICILGVFLLVNNTNAELIDRGSGLIYDSDLDITWLQDANYADTTGYAPNGWFNWWDANDWANNLVYYDSVRDVYYDNWRLPSAYNQDGSGPDYSYNSDSELGHLYYIELGNQANGPLTYTGPFNNVKHGRYWFKTYTDGAWYYDFDRGEQYTRQPASSDTFYAWAVREGDVATVIPEPVSSILFISGGAFFAGRCYLKRKKQ